MFNVRYSILVASGLALLGCGSDNPAEAAEGDDAAASQDTAAADTSTTEDSAAQPDLSEDSAPDVDEDSAPDAEEDAGSAACDTTVREVTFETEDGVTLVADYHPGTNAQAPAVVLFHMIPPSWDRQSYPERVRLALNETGAAVLNVDRRGAGDSGGTAIDAYEGDGGRFDAEAAVRFLLADEDCPVDPARIGLVGASNGTTTVMDYATAHAEELPAAAGIAWLSPGGYTENQNTVADNQERLEATPLLIVHPVSEPWSNQFAENTPEAWTIVRIVGGAHGTVNFDEGDNEAQQLPALVEWAASL